MQVDTARQTQSQLDATALSHIAAILYYCRFGVARAYPSLRPTPYMEIPTDLIKNLEANAAKAQGMGPYYAQMEKSGSTNVAGSESQFTPRIPILQEIGWATGIATPVQGGNGLATHLAAEYFSDYPSPKETSRDQASDSTSTKATGAKFDFNDNVRHARAKDRELTDQNGNGNAADAASDRVTPATPTVAQSAADLNTAISDPLAYISSLVPPSGSNVDPTAAAQHEMDILKQTFVDLANSPHNAEIGTADPGYTAVLLDPWTGYKMAALAQVLTTKGQNQHGKPLYQPFDLSVNPSQVPNEPLLNKSTATVNQLSIDLEKPQFFSQYDYVHRLDFTTNDLLSTNQLDEKASISADLSYYLLTSNVSPTQPVGSTNAPIDVELSYNANQLETNESEDFKIGVSSPYAATSVSIGQFLKVDSPVSNVNLEFEDRIKQDSRLATAVPKNDSLLFNGVVKDELVLFPNLKTDSSFVNVTSPILSFEGQGWYYTEDVVPAGARANSLNGEFVAQLAFPISQATLGSTGSTNSGSSAQAIYVRYAAGADPSNNYVTVHSWSFGFTAQTSL
jgi:hypothetical protein